MKNLPERMAALYNKHWVATYDIRSSEGKTIGHVRLNDRERAKLYQDEPGFVWRKQAI